MESNDSILLYKKAAGDGIEVITFGGKMKMKPFTK